MSFINKESEIFNVSRNNLIGIVSFITMMQFIIVILIGDSTVEGYHSGLYFVSSFGTGSHAIFFNISVIILGIGVLINTYLIHKEYAQLIPTVLLLLTGICALGVGFFPENARPFHGIFTGFLFIFAALFLISSIKLEQSFFMLIISLAGLTIFISSFIFLPYLGLEVESDLRYLGLLKGTLERFIIYSSIFSFILFGGYISRDQ